jgi:SAM-dependent methyltransferase
MGEIDKKSFNYSWEETIEVLRCDPTHQKLIFDAYLTADIGENCRRFYASGEFAEVLDLLKAHAPYAKALLDIPGGNGIATAAFAKAGFTVTAVEPDPSDIVGRGAIKKALHEADLHADLVDAYGENLPLSAESFDVVYVRQGLHHASDLRRALSEYFRVLRPGGILLACREHVVDNYGASLKAFLDSQPDHKLYGGENAFTLGDYRSAIEGAGLVLLKEWDPFESIINLSPGSPEMLHRSILKSRPGRVLSCFLPAQISIRIGLWWLRRKRQPGRIYSFMAIKPGKRS